MRRRLLTLCLLLAALGWPGAALRAEVATNITKDESQQVTSADINSSSIDLTVIQDVSVQGSGSAEGSIYENLEGNQITEADGQSTARIAEGFSAASGVVSVNQSPGESNNQANVVSFAYVQVDGDSLLMSGGAGEVMNRDNVVEATNMTRTNIIEAGAFKDFTGALQLNQSAGNLNNQNNIVAIAAGAQGRVALSDAALGQQVSNNRILETAVTKQDIIRNNAFDHVCGIISINQSSGCGNNQTNMIIISVQQYH